MQPCDESNENRFVLQLCANGCDINLFLGRFRFPARGGSIEEEEKKKKKKKNFERKSQ
jgi:hypothetical protein